MPTPSSTPASTTGPTPASTPNRPHERRDIAESFGTDPERYDRARPRYPEALVRRIVDALPGPDVLDVGCGTGISARQFQEAGCTVLGVDPDPRMAALARRLGTDVEVATFEEWEPRGRRFDAVVAGTAWHWVDHAAGVAKAAKLLRPGGLLALFWNVADIPADLAEAVADSCERVMPDAPFDFRAALTRSMVDGYQTFLVKAADGIREAGGFDEPEQWRYDWEFTYTRDAWLDVVPTQGAFTRLPPDKLAEILTAVGAAIDARGGTVTMPYATLAVTARRT
ncbi:class I SAM-dependent methyltransferase [Streptomyces sp. AF1B]|jgi:SAM-dependent methyltransferase|uniref:class I SAM-dependent methyltransferase n=1 Tax=Streptomyces sp. AF1B TaxID=3399503 RepID=UPI003AAAC3A1